LKRDFKPEIKAFPFLRGRVLEEEGIAEVEGISIVGWGGE
jgi:hypothetical protein